jgi:phosphate uptake regulator
METRKVQITGGSTYTVSLPKEWARDNAVEAGSTVAFYPDGESLVVTPGEADAPTEGTLDISEMASEHLVRAVMTMYVSGFEVIALEADRITAEQRRAIRKATQSLVGLEVLEETAGRVVIQDLLDSSELSITNAIDRMRLIARSMLEDAVTALAENDDDLARDVIHRDDDVDRLWFVVSRTFRASLRAPSAVEELGLPREVCFDYHSSARQLERIADHAAKIGQLTLDLEAIPSEVVEALEALHEEASGVMDTAMDALTHEDSDRATALANEARESILGIDAHAREIDALLRNLEPQQARNLGLIVDSLSRTADYGGNIAETALQKAAPSP